MSEFVPTHKFADIELRPHTPAYRSTYKDKEESFSKRGFHDAEGRTYALPTEVVVKLQPEPKAGEVWVSLSDVSRPIRTVASLSGRLAFKNINGVTVYYINDDFPSGSYRKVLNADGSVYKEDEDE